MKKLLLLCTCLFAIMACEQIDDKSRLIDNPNPPESNRVILLEEFTGLGCINCPDAALIASALHQQYPENVVVVGLHGDIIPRYTNPIGTTDFRIKEVKDYFNFFGPFGALPQGMLSRTKIDGNQLVDRSKWGAQLLNLMQEMPKVEITTQAKKSSGTIDITVDVKSLTDLNSPVNLVVQITEDGIVGNQMMPDGSLNTTYVHNHVLRAVLSDTWGDAIDIQKMGAIVHKTYQYAVPSTVDVDKCIVVSYVAERSGNRSVLQASALEMQEAIPPTSIELNRANLTISEGNTKMLFAHLLPEGAFGKVTWETGDASIATVKGGTITAISAGSTMITARTGDLSATCNLTVIPPVSTTGWELHYLDANGDDQVWDKEVELTLEHAEDNFGIIQMKFDGTLINNEEGTSNYHIDVVREYAVNPDDPNATTDEVCTNNCFMTNGEATQTFDFESEMPKGKEAIFYAHCNPVVTGDYIINYYFYKDGAEDQKRLITVTYHYVKK